MLVLELLLVLALKLVLKILLAQRNLSDFSISVKNEIGRGLFIDACHQIVIIVVMSRVVVLRVMAREVLWRLLDLLRNNVAEHGLGACCGSLPWRLDLDKVFAVMMVFILSVGLGELHHHLLIVWIVLDLVVTRVS